MRVALALLLLAGACQPLTPTSRPRVLVDRDDARGIASISADGHALVTWHYGGELALPHGLLRSPSGRQLLEPRPDPYPHHRALWIADKVQLDDGPIVDFYHCHLNQVDPKDPTAGHRHRIRQQSMSMGAIDDGAGRINAELQWLTDGRPVLDDSRTLVVTPLGEGELLLDLRWTLTAKHGQVTFHSDAVHYAWPYLRLHPQFSVASGGTMVDDQGRAGQAATHGQSASWIDCSNTVDGVTEGVALMLPGDAAPRAWLTRDYGCFGPRREAARSGVKFTLAQGEAISGRVGILVHRGDAVSGRVAERYRAFAEGPR